MSNNPAPNLIPQLVLERHNANQVVLMSDRDLGAKVVGTTTFRPEAVHEQQGLESLVEVRESEGVHRITLTVVKLTVSAIEQATEYFENRFRIVAELDSLLRHHKDVNVAYVVTHFNHRPLRDFTVFVGGDCYRTGPEIKDLEAVMGRTRDLARAMIRKAVMVFPDIPALHGGKKGEWIVLDEKGNKLEGLSDEALVALGTLVIPKGIRFLNEYKEWRAAREGIFEAFPARNFIRPDTASPDVMSGPNWRAMCSVWASRGIDLASVTCLPRELGGPRVPSSNPTAHGCVATALALTRRFDDRPLSETSFLLEALGGVGQTTVEALIERGVQPKNILAFDRNAEACKRAQDRYHVEALTMGRQEFYEELAGSERKFDVWVNNGEGDNTTPAQVRTLLKTGVRIFCGAANNLFRVRDEQESRERVFAAGGWVWPDAASSGGGWTLAVIDLLTRAQGLKANDERTRQHILDTICSRNERLVDEVMTRTGANGRPGGGDVWNAVDEIINHRVEETLAREASVAEIRELADVRNWNTRVSG